MKVLVVCNRLAPTLELAHLVRALPRLSSLEPVVLLGAPDLKQALAPDVFNLATEHVLTKEIAHPLGFNPGRMWSIAAKAARAFRFDVLADFLLVLRAAKIGEHLVDALLKKHPSICAVITADDRSLGFEFGVVHAARKRGIPSVTVPFALSDPGGDWLRRREREEFSVIAGNRWTRRLKQKLANTYPANVRAQEGVQLMFLTSGQVLGLQYLGAPFPAPWAYGGGATDMVTLYSESIKARQLALGVPAHKLAVTGQCAMDDLHALAMRKEELKHELSRRYGLRSGQPVIVLAVPQHAEHGLMAANQHDALTTGLFGDLGATGAALLLSLHPRSRPENYRQAAERAGAVISKQPLLEILPAADLFVATHSSTVRWAVLLGLPTLVLDDFGVGADGMFEAGSVTFVTNRSDVKESARSMLAQAQAEQGKKMRSPAPELFDGNSARRVVTLLESLVARGATGQVP